MSNEKEDVVLKDGNFKKIGMYAIHDEKSDVYDVPFFARSDLMAKRRFIVDVRNEQSLVHAFKEDFKLVRLGLLDLVSGHFTAMVEVLLTGKECEE